MLEQAKAEAEEDVKAGRKPKPEAVLEKMVAGRMKHVIKKIADYNKHSLKMVTKQLLISLMKILQKSVKTSTYVVLFATVWAKALKNAKMTL